MTTPQDLRGFHWTLSPYPGMHRNVIKVNTAKTLGTVRQQFMGKLVIFIPQLLKE